MIKKLRQIIAITVALLTITALLPLYSLAGEKLTPDDAIAWAEAQVGKALDYDHINGVQCVDLIMYYYEYLGVKPVSGNGCDYATNPLPAGWTRIKGGVPQKGDILVYSYITSSAGHVAIYGGGTTMYHGRFGVGVVTKTTDRTYNWVSGYWGCIRPDFSKAGQSASDGLTFRLNETMNVRSGATTSAKTVGQLSAGSSVSVWQITPDNWGEISYGSGTAWMLLDYSTFVSGTYSSDDVLNMRSTPSVSGTIINTVAKSTKLTIQKIDPDHKNWGYATDGGKTGWVCLSDGADREAEVDWLMVDVSQWNDPARLDWNKLKAAGVKAAILRIGGRYVNSKVLYDDDAFLTHYKNAKAAGIHVGVYFFSYALSEAQAREEAQKTIDTLSKYDCELDMPVFIDIEDYSESNGTDHQHSRAGKTVCTTVVNTFCDEIEKAGYYPGIYCSKSFAEDLIDASAFNNRAVWIAHYGVSQCGYSGNYDIWQYTRYGSLNGAGGEIDLNQCYTDFPSLIADRKEGNYGEHIAGEWETVKAASCGTPGKQQKKCTDCGTVLATQELPALSHTPSDICILLLDTTLITPGKKLTNDIRSRLHFSADQDFGPMMYLTAWETQGGTKLTYCTTCNQVLTAEYSYPTCSHSSCTDKVTKAATCTSEGIKETVCKSCNKTVYATVTSALKHREGDKKYDRTSCTLPGTCTTTCSVCGQTISISYVMPSQHVPGEWTELTKLTCVTDGTYSSKCTICGEELSRLVSHPDYGDIDTDGKISASDARLALRAAVGLEKLSDTAAAAADTNADGKVDAYDARALLRFSVGLDDSAKTRITYFGQ